MTLKSEKTKRHSQKMHFNIQIIIRLYQKYLPKELFTAKLLPAIVCKRRMLS